jgi:hypothetical protein
LRHADHVIARTQKDEEAGVIRISDSGVFKQAVCFANACNDKNNESKDRPVSKNNLSCF